MIDWNQNGKIDYEDMLISEVLLTDEEDDDTDKERSVKQNEKKPCLLERIFSKKEK